MKKLIFIVLVLANTQLYADVLLEEGQSLYSSKGCIGCHGANGVSSNPSMFPVLAGLEKSYVKEQLIAFKTYKRRNPMMNGMAAVLSEKEIEKLAIFLSAQEK